MKTQEMGMVPEQQNKIAEKKCTFRLGETNVQLKKKKSSYPGYVQVEIIFEDIYKSELVDKFNWTEEQIDNFDNQLYAKLKEKDAVVDWEDKELFTVDIPESATDDIICDVRSAILSAVKEPLDNQQLSSVTVTRKEGEEKARELAKQELNKVRQETELFRGYKEKRGAESLITNEGYCTIEMTKIKKTSGIGYDDDEFLGKENRKIVTKPDMIILSISIQGQPFDQLYHGRTIKSKDFGGSYESELRKIIQNIPSTSKDLVKMSHRVSWRKNKDEAGGENLKLLCTEEFAEKVVEKIKSIYPDLHDILKAKTEK